MLARTPSPAIGCARLSPSRRFPRARAKSRERTQFASLARRGARRPGKTKPILPIATLSGVIFAPDCANEPNFSLLYRTSTPTYLENKANSSGSHFAPDLKPPPNRTNEPNLPGSTPLPRPGKTNPIPLPPPKKPNEPMSENEHPTLNRHIPTHLRLHSCYSGISPCS